MRQVALGAYAHQDLPFELLVDELQPQRNLNHAPIFQVMFIVQNSPPPMLQLGNLGLSSLPVEEGKAQFDLTLALVQVEDQLTARLEYSLDLFDAATAERLMRHFDSLLGGALEGAGRISRLPLLDATGRRELLMDQRHLGGAAGRGDGARAVRGRARRQRRRSPSPAPAPHLPQWTSLDPPWPARWCGGVAPEVRVDSAGRTPELLVSMLAVLKAGGAASRSTQYPIERLAWTSRTRGIRSGR